MNWVSALENYSLFYFLYFYAIICFMSCNISNLLAFFMARQVQIPRHVNIMYPDKRIIYNSMRYLKAMNGSFRMNAELEVV